MRADLESLPDEELACQTRAGSLAAFEELVRRYEARIFRFILNSCQRDADARELTQDVFLRAFRAISQFDPRYPFPPWLFTIARRKCIDFHRAARPVTEEILVESPDPDDPARLLELAEERDNLWRLARAHLPETQFQALWLKYAEEMSVAQIARVLRKTQTHIKVLLFRARQTLAGVLEAETKKAYDESMVLEVQDLRHPR